MRIWSTACVLLALAACAEDVPVEEQADENRALAERVREMNDTAPPLQEVVPDPILYPDIEAYDLYGPACAYAPGTSMGARVIAREVDAFMKIDGEIIRFAADPGARELPANTSSLYNGREYSLRLDMSGNGEEVSGSDTPLNEGTIWLRDRYDRVIYTGTGAVECGD